jgi:hypothetical protein
MTGPLKLAQAGSGPKAGVVLDYQLLNSAANVTLRGDLTYYVSGTVNLSGTTTIEGGAVIKFTNSTSAMINFTGPINCRTTPFRHGVFTAKDEDGLGECIPGSIGTPSGHYANPALYIDSYTSGYPANLSHLRIAYARVGINYYTGSGHILSHAQFVRCRDAVVPYYCDASLRNVLIYDSTNVINGSYSSTVRGEHLTLDQANALNYGYATLYLTNSLIVAMPNTGYSGSNNKSASSGSGVFQTVGAGSHYLATNGWRNAGTTNISGTARLTSNRPQVMPGNGVTTCSITCK